VNVRIVAATNRDLSDMVREGNFREDLFYRLSVVPINIPPLRERKEDIPSLVVHFLQKYNKIAKKNISATSSQVDKALIGYDWPGNIRELENTMERAVVLSKGDRIDLDSLMYFGISSSPSFMQSGGGDYKSLEEVEKEYIQTVLQAQGGNKSRTAEILGVDRKTLQTKVKKYSL
jgi:two-component system response regulator HydG